MRQERLRVTFETQYLQSLLDTLYHVNSMDGVSESLRILLADVLPQKYYELMLYLPRKKGSLNIFCKLKIL